MPSGRLREVTPPDEELHELGKELVKWAKNDHAKPPHTRMAQYYSLERGIIRKDWKSIIQCRVFLPYYEKAKALLAARVMDTDVLHQSFGHRFIRLYDRDMAEEEDEQAKMKADLARKKEEQEHDASARSIAQAIAEISQDSKGVPRASEPGRSEVAHEPPVLDQRQAGEQG